LNPEQIIALINLAMQGAAVVIQAGKDAAPFAKAIYDDIVGKQTITPEEGAAIEAKIAQLTEDILRPIDPALPNEI